MVELDQQNYSHVYALYQGKETQGGIIGRCKSLYRTEGPAFQHWARFSSVSCDLASLYDASLIAPLTHPLFDPIYITSPSLPVCLILSSQL